jgi:hypothetical protein
MTRQIQFQLKENRKEIVAYSNATYEYTDVTDIAKLAVFIRHVNGGFQLMVVIELVPMQEETGADEIFHGFVTYFIKYVLPPKMVGWLVAGLSDDWQK